MWPKFGAPLPEVAGLVDVEAVLPFGQTGYVASDVNRTCWRVFLSEEHLPGHRGITLAADKGDRRQMSLGLCLITIIILKL